MDGPITNEEMARNLLKILYSKMIRADFSGKDTIIQLDDGKIVFIEIVDKIGGNEDGEIHDTGREDSSSEV